MSPLYWIMKTLIKIIIGLILFAAFIPVLDFLTEVL